MRSRCGCKCHNPPMRFFNTEGPIRPDDHYAIPQCGAEEGHLVVIDRRGKASERQRPDDQSRSDGGTGADGRRVTVWRL